MYTFDQIRAAFPHGQVVSGKWVTRCILPGHDDHNPSLTIHVSGGKVLCVCTCGRQDELFAAVMKKLRENGTPAATSPIKQTETGWTYTDSKIQIAAQRIEQAADFLKTRGISIEVARKHKLGFESIGGKEYLVIPTFFEGDLVAVKLRALYPVSKRDKWKKWKRDEGVYYLFNREAAETAMLGDDLYIVESELDSLTAETAGFYAVSVDSAKHKLNERDVLLLRRTLAQRIFAPDRDDAGLACAFGMATDLELDSAVGLQWPGKDLGELYAENPATFCESMEKLTAKASPLWRHQINVGIELGAGDPVQPIEHILIEGINFIGSLSGVGKTWLALSMAKALVSGQPFLGNPAWRVPEKRNVLYLVPEMGDRAFRARMEKMRLPMDSGIYVQTIRHGALDLRSPLLLQAIHELNPVLFLDTAIRFSTSESENDSQENAGTLSKKLFDLRNEGVDCITALHHSPKAASDNHVMTLENVLRGTGEFGACADVVWGIQRAQRRKGNNTWDDQYLAESKQLTRLYCECVKPRDLPAADAFVIQGRPHIDEKGDFGLLATDAQVGETMDPGTVSESAADKAENLVRENPTISKSKLAQDTGISRNRVEEVLSGRAWQYVAESKREGRWERMAQADGESEGAESGEKF